MQNNLSLKIECLDIYNLALYNNSIPLIDELTITNDTDYNLKNIDVEISSFPSFFAPYVTKIGNISSGRHITANPRDLDIDLTKVMYSSTPITSIISVKAKSLGETVSETTKSITLYPYNYIPSLDTYTELISAYVTPEQGEIKIVAEKVCEHLKKDFSLPINQDMWDLKDKAFTSCLIQSIYYAICDLKITINSHVSNDNKPTRIKLPENVISSQNGTSTEIALLTASVAEYLGINSFITFVTDKVLVGFFYSNDSFKTCICDDTTYFSKLSNGKCDKFVIVDTTSMMYGTNVTFDNSSLTAQKSFEQCDSPVTVDISKCRKNGYRSLPTRTKQDGNIIFELQTAEANSITRKFAFTKTPEAFSKFVSKNFSGVSASSNDIFLKNDKTIFLIGNTKHIVSKFLFNNVLTIKYFPLSSQTNDSFNFFDKIVQLNNNIDTGDFSHTINAFDDKKELLSKASKIIKARDDNYKNICAGFGIVKYSFDGQMIISPVFYCDVDLSSNLDGSTDITPISSDLKISPSIIELFNKASIDYDFEKYSENYIENYDLIIREIGDVCSSLVGFEIFDITTISAMAIDSLSLSSIATPEYFENSNILKHIFKNEDLSFSLSDENNNIQLSIPMPLDSAEEEAVKTAIKSPCTIFKGPDGSGKTTACATTVFNAINNGEKVLYLSSSKANLESFGNYARKYGFDGYIFKVTDNKVNGVTETTNNIKHNDYRNTNEKLSSAITNESSYYKSLHGVKEIGFSLYEAISQYERYRSFPYSVTFTHEQIGKLGKDDVVLWFDTVSQLAKAGAECKEPHSNPLFYIKESNFSYDLKSKAAISLSRHLTITQNFIDAQNSLTEFIGIEVPIMKESQTKTLLELSECIINNGEYIYNGIFLKKDIDSSFSRIEIILSQCENYFELKDFLNNNFKKDVVMLDCGALLTEWRNANSKFAFSKQSALTLVKNKLKAYSINPKLVSNDNFADLVAKIADFVSASELLQENAQLILEVTGIDVGTILESGDYSDFDKIKRYIATSRKYLKTLIDIYDVEQQPSTVFAHNYNLFRTPTKLKSDISDLFSLFSSTYKSYVESEKEVSNLLKIDTSSAKEQNGKIWYYFVVQFFDKMLTNIDLLKYWCNWNVERTKAISVGLGNVVSLYESEQLSSGDIKNAFLKGFFKSVSEYFLSLDDSTNSFSSDKHKQQVKEIEMLISENSENVIDELKNSVNNRINDYLQSSNLSYDDAVSIINRSIASGATAFRDKGLVDLLTEIKPCFVFDTVKSILKFYPNIKFDLIVIDGAIKQTPYEISLLIPLAKRIIYTETQDTFFGDFLRHIGAHSISFNWIYNSNKTMSFINELFYNNSLSVVPQMNYKNSKVNVVYQLGNYDRRKSRVNVIEASAVVDEIMKIISDTPTKSIGIYTMTEEQKQLVEFLLQKRNNGEYSTPISVCSFAKAEYDPKDYVIFSTVFSKEEKSKYKESITRTIPELSMSDSHYRMLNILSSATGEFTIITSLSKDSLENFRTTEQNYILFKKFLNKMFSEDTSRAEKISVCDVAENSIIRQVASFIESIGYKADLKIGSNKYIVDIAVKNKGSDNYLLGIMFDETAYINSNNFFGRSLIFDNLKTIGSWELFTIHTVEWFENPNKQLDIISAMLNHDKSEIVFLN